MEILIMQLSPPFCYFFSCKELYSTTLWKRQDGTSRTSSIIYLLKRPRIVVSLVNIKDLVIYSTACGYLTM
jgi:hypothetical protein